MGGRLRLWNKHTIPAPLGDYQNLMTEVPRIVFFAPTTVRIPRKQALSALH